MRTDRRKRRLCSTWRVNSRSGPAMCARRERDRLLTRSSGWRTIAGAYRRLRIYGSAPQLPSPFLHTGCRGRREKRHNIGHRQRGRVVARGWTCIAGDLLWCTTHRARSHYIPSLSPSLSLSHSLSFSLSFSLFTAQYCHTGMITGITWATIHRAPLVDTLTYRCLQSVFDHTEFGSRQIFTIMRVRC